MPKGNGVPSESQVKAAVKRTEAALTEAEASVQEIRVLASILIDARDTATQRLNNLLSNPTMAAGQAHPPLGPMGRANR